MLEKLKRWVLHGTGWAFAIFFLLVGLSFILDSVWHTLSWLVLAAACVPRVPLPPIGRAVGIFGGFLLVAVTMAPVQDAQAERQEQERLEEVAQRFETEQEEILSQAEAALDGGDWRGALRRTETFQEAVDDPQLDSVISAARQLQEQEERAATAARKQAEIDRIEDRLRTVPASDAILNRNLHAPLKRRARCRFSGRWPSHVTTRKRGTNGDGTAGTRRRTARGFSLLQ